MKVFSRIILLLTISFITIISQDNIADIVQKVYSQISKLPVGSTIYYSRNIKCSNYNSTSSICLINGSLYKTEGENNYILLHNITGYSDSFYYELNIYNDSMEYINCLITHFYNQSLIIFKYYSINIFNNSFSNNDYTYYNKSVNPLNKGINCQTNDTTFNFNCFYINNDKNIIQMDISKINGTNKTKCITKIASISNKNIVIPDNNILIMSSFFQNKFKFFSCIYCNKSDLFSIFVPKIKNVEFENGVGGRGGGDNEFQTLNFNCENNDKIILFTAFKSQCIENDYCITQSLSNNINLYVFYQLIKTPPTNDHSPDKRTLQFSGEDSSNDNINLKTINSIESLIYEEKVNILLFKPQNVIESFQFSKNQSQNNENINPTSAITNQNNISKTSSTNELSLANKSNQIINNPDTFSPTISQNVANNPIEPMEKRNIREIKMPIKNITKEEVLENVKVIMNDVTIGEIYEYQKDDFSVLIYPTNSTLLTDKTHIDYIECEYNLKNHYNLSNQSILTFFQMEISNKNKRSLINQVEYQVYDEQKNPLDLSVCNDSNIKIFYEIKNNSNLDISVLNSFKDSGVNVFNISDEFFNDVCYSYSENGNDLILEDRINDIYQNFTLCEEGCTFDSIDIFNMLIACQCDIKENITTIIKEIQEEAAEKITSLNFEIIQCYNLVFSLKGKMKNIGFWILSAFFLIYIISLIKYCCEGIKPVKDYIFNEMTKYGYINKDKKENNKNINTIIINNPPKKIKFVKKKKNINNNNNLKINQKKSKNPLVNNTKKAENNIKKIKNYDLNLITIDLNKLSQKYIPNIKESNITLYNYTMEEAFRYDRRNIIETFYIYLLSKQAFFHAFLYRTPLILFPLRFCLLLFILSSDLALNAFFYFNDNISRKYKNTKNLFIFILSNNMTVVLLSTLVGFIILTLFTNLSNTTKAIRDVFKNEEKKIRKNKNYKVTQKRKDDIKKEIENILQKYKCKLIILFSFEIILMIFFWYYVVVFCHVFSGTQTSWLIDSALSMISRIIIDILFCLLFSKIYRIAVASNYNCIYKIALFFYGFG